MAMVEGEEVAASVSKREPASPSLCADCASSSADLSHNAVPAALGRFLAASALRAASSAIVHAGVSVDEGVDLVRVGVGVLDRLDRAFGLAGAAIGHRRMPPSLGRRAGLAPLPKVFLTVCRPLTRRSISSGIV